MVRRFFVLFFTTTLFALLPSLSSAAIPDYKIGDQAQEDVIASARLDVVDQEATAKLKSREAERVFVIYRHYPRAMDEAEAAFRSTFTTTRSNFLDALDPKWREQDVANLQGGTRDEFQTFLGRFQKQNILYPVNADLAARWIAGGSDEELVSGLSSRLRDTMRNFIRSDVAPPDVWVGSTLRLVSLADNETMTARLADERGRSVPKTNFVSLQRAKTELQDTFTPEERAVGRYLASFVKPNCLMEADLTRELRARRTEGLVSADHYEAGQAIVRRGQTVDKKILAALNQVRQETAATTPPPTPTPAPAQVAVVAGGSQMRWLAIALGGIFVMLIALFWLVARRRPDSLLPARVENNPLDLTGDDWRQRALQAEQRAQKMQDAARTGLLSQLAHWWANRATQKLVSQRARLMDAHQTAAIEIAELEARLEKVHAPLQERLQAYERRIAELEKELEVKGNENRELIKAKIEIARKQLEIERGKTRPEFN